MLHWCASIATVGCIPNTSCLRDHQTTVAVHNLKNMHRCSCLTTMFESICREDITTTAQVSSAELSRASTVKERDLHARKAVNVNYAFRLVLEWTHAYATKTVACRRPQLEFLHCHLVWHDHHECLQICEISPVQTLSQSCSRVRSCITCQLLHRPRNAHKISREAGRTHWFDLQGWVQLLPVEGNYNECVCLRREETSPGAVIVSLQHSAKSRSV